MDSGPWGWLVKLVMPLVAINC